MSSQEVVHVWVWKLFTMSVVDNTKVHVSVVYVKILRRQKKKMEQ